MSKQRAIRSIWFAAAALTIGVVGVAVVHAVSPDPHAAVEALAAPVSLAPAPGVTTQGRALLEQFSAAFEHAAQAVNPSVVPILNERKVPAAQFLMGPEGSGGFPGPEFLRRFFGLPGGPDREETLRSLGSGVIISEDGYILTNNHVVQDADKLIVVVGEDKKLPAEVIGTDPQTDVAVIKVDAHDLPVAMLGDSDGLQVGQWVVAVGNPLQMLHSVTAGIVSATGRSAIGLADYEDFIQTDASVNPGNSGGALADLDGRVIGINTAIASPSGGNVGVGFAIPINMARRVTSDLIAHGRVSRGYLGIVLQSIDEDLARALDLDGTTGALVSDVEKDGPAAEAGMLRGDVILAFDGQSIKDSTALRNLVAAAKPHERATLRIVRDHKEETLSVTLGERPAAESTPTAGPPDQGAPHRRLGLTVADPTPELARRFGYEQVQGVLITAVEPGSPADEVGLRPGDAIEAVGPAQVHSVAELQRALAEAESGEPVALLVRRARVTFFVPLNVR